MAFLTIGGNNIPVHVSDVPDIKQTEIGDRARAIDGTMRETIYARKREWRFQTIPVDVTTAGLILGYITAAAPLSLNGDVVANSAVLVFCSFEQKLIAKSGTFYVVFVLTFWEQ